MATPYNPPANTAESARQTRRANQRTAFILVLIAAVFFGGIIAAQLGGADSASVVGISVLGLAIIGYLIVALGRNVRTRRRATE